MSSVSLGDIAVTATYAHPLPLTSRYRLLLKIASGGMATVYVGCLSGAGGFRRIVAIKRAHPHLLEDAACKRMLVSEAKMAALVRHPNVIGVQDVEELDGELLLVMDYVEGGSLAQVLRASTGPASALGALLALRVIRDACEGLHAMHQLRDDDGRPLNLVHRDISPQNILVGMDGMSRVADFGIAKSSSPEWSSHTDSGALRGKTGYMAPEYIETTRAIPQGDIFSLGVVAWEALTNRRLFKGPTDVETIRQVRTKVVPPPSEIVPHDLEGLDEVILKALARDPLERFQTARAFGEAIDLVLAKNQLPATHGAMEAHMELIFHEALEKRRAAVRRLQAAPPPRPVSVSEVSDVVPAEIPIVVDEDPPPRAYRERAYFYLRAAIAVVATMLASIVAFELSRRPPEAAMTTAAIVTGSTTTTAPTTLTAIEGDRIASTTLPTQRIPDPPDHTTEHSTAPVITKPRVTTEPVTPPKKTSTVPKNPYAP